MTLWDQDFDKRENAVDVNPHPAEIDNSTKILIAGEYAFQDGNAISFSGILSGPNGITLIGDETGTITLVTLSAHGTEVAIDNSTQGPSTSFSFVLVPSGTFNAPGGEQMLLSVHAEGEIQNSHEGEAFGGTREGAADFTRDASEFLPGFSSGSLTMGASALDLPQTTLLPEPGYIDTGTWDLIVDWALSSVGSGVWRANGIDPFVPLFTSPGPGSGSVTIANLNPNDSIEFSVSGGGIGDTIDLTLDGTNLVPTRKVEGIGVFDGDYDVYIRPTF